MITSIQTALCVVCTVTVIAATMKHLPRVCSLCLQRCRAACCPCVWCAHSDSHCISHEATVAPLAHPHELVYTLCICSVAGQCAGLLCASADSSPPPKGEVRCHSLSFCMVSAQ